MMSASVKLSYSVLFLSPGPDDAGNLTLVPRGFKGTIYRCVIYSANERCVIIYLPTAIYSGNKRRCVVVLGLCVVILLFHTLLYIL